jgi:hypothetical protein
MKRMQIMGVGNGSFRREPEADVGTLTKARAPP